MSCAAVRARQALPMPMPMPMYHRCMMDRSGRFRSKGCPLRRWWWRQQEISRGDAEVDRAWSRRVAARRAPVRTAPGDGGAESHVPTTEWSGRLELGSEAIPTLSSCTP